MTKAPGAAGRRSRRSPAPATRSTTSSAAGRCSCWRASSWRSCCCSPACAGRSRCVGLGFSLALVLLFVVPAILDGKPPLAVAVVGSLAVALITIPLAHGGGPKSLAALLGTAASLLLTALLAVMFTKLAHLTGLLERGGRPSCSSAGADLSLAGPAAGGHGDRRAGRARRRDRQPGLDGAGAAPRQPEPRASASCSGARCASGATTSARP